jgi:hypothetical protein
LPRAALALSCVAIFISACRAPLPDKDSPAAQLYARRCDNCHRPYNPKGLTAAMWELKVKLMEPKMQTAGMPPLTPDERASILAYLERYAGTD